MKTLLWLAIPMLVQGCANPCDRAEDRTVDKYEGCGIELLDAGAPTYECTAAVAKSASCDAECVAAADCGVLDGTNIDYSGPEWTAYAACSEACYGG